MALEISDLDETWQPAAIAYVRRLPYRNAIPLSNVTQLRQHCDVVVAHSNGYVQGVASHYRRLPFPGVTFIAELGEALPTLLAALAERVPRLQNELLGTVVPAHRATQLAQCSVVESLEPEVQMVVEPDTLRPVLLPNVQRLGTADIPAMSELAAVSDLAAWRPDVLEHGPAYGVFADDRLVAMAATHFATTDVIEIGNIATHPDYQRRGFARACTSALTQNCFSLAPRVYLLVLEANQAAYTAYRGLGFWPAERFAFVHFRLSTK